MRFVWISLPLVTACGDLPPALDATVGEDASVEEDAAEPCNALTVRRDEDGDGRAGASAETRELCAPDATLPGFVTETGDCDDHDPNVFRSVCADLDGDGLVAYHCAGTASLPSERPCPYVLEWTPEPGPYDCDDADPTLLDYAFLDLDDDGIGGGDKRCASKDDVYSAWGGDCDDADPTRSPTVAERYGDGIDSDCDGRDGNACDDFPYEFTAGAQPSCVGTNLALGLVSCSSCYVPRSTFAVLNRGAARVQTQVRLLQTEDDGTGRFPLTFSLDLAAGQQVTLASAPVAGEFTLQLLAGSDCDPQDNATDAPYGHCI